MANWQRRLELADVWDIEENGKSVAEIADIVGKRLRALKPIGYSDIDHEQEDIADTFDDLASDPDLDADEFDNVMQMLYEWADTPLPNWPRKKVCWVATF